MKIKQESENGLSVIFARLVSIWYWAPYEKEISGVYFIFLVFFLSASELIVMSCFWKQNPKEYLAFTFVVIIFS